MSAAVTVIVAVYNVRQYLPRFMESLQGQTFTDFEALFINDASPDDSAAFIAAHAASDPRIRLLHHEQNQGVGAACNYGIREASAPMLCFADPDDHLPETSLQVRYEAYKRHNAIVRACHKEMVTDGELLNHETRPDSLPEVFSAVEAAHSVGPNPFLCAHWTWLVPTGLLRRNNIFQGEHMRTANEIILQAQLFYHLGRMVWIPDVVYHWMKRPDSLSTSHYTPEHYENYFRCCDVFYEQSAQHRQLKLADAFFNSYLVAYFGHILKQVADGTSGEPDVRAVLAVAGAVEKRHGVFERLYARQKTLPQDMLGLTWLNLARNDTSPTAIERLTNSYQTVLRYYGALAVEQARARGEVL